MPNKGVIILGGLAAAGVLTFVLTQKVGAAPPPPTGYKSMQNHDNQIKDYSERIDRLDQRINGFLDKVKG